MRLFATIAATVCIGLLCAGAGASGQFLLDDIEFWVGTGANRAALVIDWVDGADPVCLAWGYRWDGSATGEDMFMALVGTGVLRDPATNDVIGTVNGADARLGAQMVAYSFGNAMYGLGYDVDDDGGIAFDAAGQPVDADDNFHDGWMVGYWSYWTGIGNPYDGGTWESSIIGMGDRVLADGEWDGWSWNATGAWPSEPAPGVPVAATVPEPAPIMLAALGALLIGRRRRT